MIILILIAGIVYATWTQLSDNRDYTGGTLRRWMDAFIKVLTKSLTFVLKSIGFVTYGIKDFVTWLSKGIIYNHLKPTDFSITDYSVKHWDDKNWPLLQKIKRVIDSTFVSDFASTVTMSGTSTIPQMCYGSMALASVANLFCKLKNKSEDCDKHRLQMFKSLKNIAYTSTLFTFLYTASVAGTSTLGSGIIMGQWIMGHTCSTPPKQIIKTTSQIIKITKPCYKTFVTLKHL